MKNTLIVLIIVLMISGCSVNIVNHYVDDSVTKFSVNEDLLNLTNQKVAIINFAEKEFELNIPKIDSLFSTFNDTYCQHIEVIDSSKLPENVKSNIKENLYFSKPLEKEQIESIFEIINTDYLFINYVNDFESIVSAAGINQQTHSSTFNGITTLSTSQLPYTFYFNGMQSNFFIYDESSMLIQIDLIKVKISEDKINQNDFDYCDYYLSSFFRHYYLHHILEEKNIEWEFSKKEINEIYGIFNEFFDIYNHIKKINKNNGKSKIRHLKEMSYTFNEKNSMFISKLQEIGFGSRVIKYYDNNKSKKPHMLLLNYDFIEKLISSDLNSSIE